MSSGAGRILEDGGAQSCSSKPTNKSCASNSLTSPLKSVVHWKHAFLMHYKILLIPLWRSGSQPDLIFQKSTLFVILHPPFTWTIHPCNLDKHPDHTLGHKAFRSSDLVPS